MRGLDVVGRDSGAGREGISAREINIALTSVLLNGLASWMVYPEPALRVICCLVMSFEQSKLFCCAMKARGETRMEGSEFVMLWRAKNCQQGVRATQAARTYSTVKFVYGDVWQVQDTTLSESATAGPHRASVRENAAEAGAG